MLLGMAGACGSTATEDVGAARFVAVGEGGTIASSLDGVDWTVESSGVTANLSGVAAGPAIIVAVGRRGAILSSRDGVHWTERTSGTSADLSYVTFTGTKFVAVGGSWELGAVTLESRDGTSWEQVPSPPDQMFHAVAHVADTLVAAAYSRSDRQIPSLFTSTVSSGSAIGGWTPQLGPDFYDGLSIGDLTMVVGGSSVSTSTDGKTWNERALPGTRLVSGVASSGAVHAIVGELGTIYSSLDGADWIQQVSPLAQQSFRAVAYGESSFVAVGERGAIITSLDGAVWSARALDVSTWLSGVTYGPATR